MRALNALISDELLDRTYILYYPEYMAYPICLSPEATSFPQPSCTSPDPATSSPVPAFSSICMVQQRLLPAGMLRSSIAAEPERWHFSQFRANLSYRRLHIQREKCKMCTLMNQHLSGCPLELRPDDSNVAVISSREMTAPHSLCRWRLALVHSPGRAPLSLVPAATVRPSSAELPCCRRGVRHWLLSS
jgi:hypothetical protein